MNEDDQRPPTRTIVVTYTAAELATTVKEGLRPIEWEGLAALQQGYLAALQQSLSGECPKIVTKLPQAEIDYIAEVEKANPFSKKFAKKHLPPPPAIAECLAALFADRSTLNALLGDLEQMFKEHIKLFGIVRARRLYWSRVMRGIAPSIWSAIKRLISYDVIVEFIRAKIGW